MLSVSLLVDDRLKGTCLEVVRGSAANPIAGLRPVRDDDIRVPQLVPVRASLGKFACGGRLVEVLRQRARLEVARTDGEVAREGITEIDKHDQRDGDNCHDGSWPQ